MGSVGGIVRDCQSSWLSNCYNIGDIKANSNMGGIVGFIYKYASISNCYNMGTISNSTNGSNGKICIGGISGKINLSDSYKVENCYSVGKITPDISNEETTIYAGNIFGEYISGSVENCYYEKNGIAAIGKNKDGSIANTTEVDSAEIKTQKMVELLNGEKSIYCLDNTNINNGYPILEWQYVYSLRENSKVIMDEKNQ